MEEEEEEERRKWGEGHRTVFPTMKFRDLYACPLPVVRHLSSRETLLGWNISMSFSYHGKKVYRFCKGFIGSSSADQSHLQRKDRNDSLDPNSSVMMDPENLLKGRLLCEHFTLYTRGLTSASPPVSMSRSRNMLLAETSNAVNDLTSLQSASRSP